MVTIRRSCKSINFSNVGGAGGIQLSNRFSGLFTVAPTVTWNAAAGDIIDQVRCFVARLLSGVPVILHVTGAPLTSSCKGGLFEVAGTTGYLVKDGTGTLYLLGQNNYHRQHDVNGGTLLVDGTTTAP